MAFVLRGVSRCEAVQVAGESEDDMGKNAELFSVRAGLL